MEITITNEQFDQLIQTLSSSNFSWLQTGVWLVAPTVALIIAIFGWWRVENRDRKKEDREKHLIESMLKQEIEDRWPKMERLLDERILKHDHGDYELVHQLAHRRFRTDDFFVTHAVCNDFNKFTNLNHDLLKLILEAHRTWLDIIDTCDNANHLIH